MRLIPVNLADSATLNATPAMVSTLPASNLQTPFREEVARTETTAAQLIEAAWTTPKAISAVVLYRGNFSNVATWQVQVYKDATMSDLLYDSGFLYASSPKTLGELLWGIDALGASHYDQWGYKITPLYFSPVIGKYLRITLVDYANPDGYLQASRLVIGQYIETTSGPEVGAQVGPQDGSQQSRTEGGTLRTEPGAEFRRMVFTIRMLPEAERVRVSEFLRTTGKRGDFFISLFPEAGGALERDHHMLAKMTDVNMRSIPLYLRADQPFAMEES